MRRMVEKSSTIRNFMSVGGVLMGVLVGAVNSAWGVYREIGAEIEGGASMAGGAAASGAAGSPAAAGFPEKRAPAAPVLHMNLLCRLARRHAGPRVENARRPPPL